MLNKYFVIGLGGSGETLVRQLNKDVELRLRNAGWDEGVPEVWRWLCVDVAQESDVVEGGVPPELGDTGSRIGLARSPLTYAQYHERVAGEEGLREALAGALPKPTEDLPPPFLGAGQRPQVGHVVGVHELERLVQALRGELGKLSDRREVEKLGQLSNMLGIDNAEPRTTVIVASSLAGGSGAGLLQLMIEALLGEAGNSKPWLRDELVTVLFTPDVFSGLEEHEREYVEANALYTASALLNGYEATGTPDPALVRVLERGGANLLDGRRAATTNFYVGASNGVVEFEDQNAVFAATAKALGRLMVDHSVTRAMASHLRTNRNGIRVSTDFRIADVASISRPASSLGYVSITLGDAQLRDYTSELLARALLTRLLHGHQALGLPDESEGTTIERVARKCEDRFFDRAGLTTARALEGLYDQQALESEVEELAAASLAGLGGVEQATGRTWFRLIDEKFGDLDETLRQTELEQRGTATERWSRRMRDDLVAATQESLGRYGVEIARKLLKAARAQARELASELSRERQDILEPTRDTLNRASTRLSGTGDKQLGSNDPRLRAAIAARQDASLVARKASRYEHAAKLLNDLDVSLVAPLDMHVTAAADRLETSASDHDAKLVEGWPTGDALPPRLAAAPNEILLENELETPGRAKALLVKTLLDPESGGSFPDYDDDPEGACSRATEAIEKATTEILLGGELYEPPPLLGAGSWIAGESGRARFSGNVDALSLLRRAESWVTGRRGALANRLQLPIARWLDARPGRAERFADVFEQAVRVAKPLVAIDDVVHLRVHDTLPLPSKLYASPLPIAEGHPVRKRLERALTDAGAGKIGKLFDPTSPTRTIEISSFVAKPLHPIAIAGLFVPIHNHWRARTSLGERGEFASYRRTRALPYFVPLSRARLEAFVAGWIAARLLGQLDLPAGGWAERPACVWTPDGWRAFPEHLLGGVPGPGEQLLGPVLESLPLALASYAAQHFEELEAYMRILELGDQDADSLASWVRTGSPTPSNEGGAHAPTPDPRLAGPAGHAHATAEDRRAVLIGQLDAIQSEHAHGAAAVPLTRGSVTERNVQREVAPIVEVAVRRMRARLDSAIATSDNGGSPERSSALS